MPSPLLILLSAFLLPIRHVGAIQTYPSDHCGYLDTTLLLSDKNAGQFKDCICLSGVATAIKTNPVAEAAVREFGSAQVTIALTNMILSDPNVEECTYPPRAVPACTPSNPCGFLCPNGFLPSPVDAPTRCACDESDGYTLCGGQCVPRARCASDASAADAPLQIIAAPRRRWEWNGVAVSAPRRRTMCPRGQTACGVYGKRWVERAPRWQCVDTTKDEQSCGGCSTPLDAFSPWGKDCTTIVGVDEVECVRGSCMVWTCQEGFEVSLDRTRCVFVGF